MRTISSPHQRPGITGVARGQITSRPLRLTGRLALDWAIPYLIEMVFRCRLDELSVGDTVLVRGRVERVFTGERYKEKKARPAVVVWAGANVIVAPLYTSGHGKPAEPWQGVRIGLFPTARNGLQEPFSQLGARNSFTLSADNLRCRIGRLDGDDRDIARHEFLRILASERSD